MQKQWENIIKLNTQGRLYLEKSFEKDGINEDNKKLYNSMIREFLTLNETMLISQIKYITFSDVLPDLHKSLEEDIIENIKIIRKCKDSLIK